MIIANLNSGSLLHGNAPLGGTATAVGGFIGVKQLQEQLRRIAYETGKQSLDPAQYDGTMTLSTIIALANAAPVIGTSIHPVVGQALDAIDLIKAPIKLVPYGDTIIEIILSPWIIDEVYDAILGIIRLIPGGGSIASGIDDGVKAVKTALSTAAAPIAAAITLISKATRSAGFGAITNVSIAAISPIAMQAVAVPSIMTTVPDATGAPNPPPGFTWVDAPPVPGHWERLRVGQTPMPGPTGATIDIRTHTGDVTGRGAIPPPVPGRPGITRDHRDWPKGKEIVSADWGRARTYSGYAPKANLALRDSNAWEQYKNVGLTPSLSVGWGAIAFLVFTGFDGSSMGAFWDARDQTLKIQPVPDPSSTEYPWDYVADAVVAAADAVASVAQDTWNWIAENANDVYQAIKKYGCAIVNNDIVVGIAAGAAGIVATPAASAAVITGATAGRAGCAVLEVAEALYAIYQLLSMDFPQPVPLTSPTPPEPRTFVPLRGLQVIMPDTPPTVPLAKSKYPPGSIAAFDPKIQRHRIAIPIGTQLQLGTSGLTLGATPTHFEVAQTIRAPLNVPLVPLTPYQKQTDTLPLYKNPLFWTAIGVGVVAVGGGSYVLYRRRRRLTT